jgi:adenosine kinase
MKKVIVSGYVSLDRIVRIKTPAATGFTSLIANKTNSDIQYGGCSVNIAYALCKLGIHATPVVRVGDDYETSGLKTFLESAGIPCDAVESVNGERTSNSYLIEDGDGRHTTLFYPGAMSGEYFHPLDKSLFVDKNLGVLTVGDRRDNEEFVGKCLSAGIPLAFGMKGDLDAFPSDSLYDLLGKCELIFTNEAEREEMERLLNRNLLSFLEQNARIIATTRGKDGSSVYYKDGGAIIETKVAAYPNDDALTDRSGCGDAYISGFLYGYLNGKAAPNCALLGSVLASFAAEREGCCAGLPDEKRFLKRYEEFYGEGLI